MEVNKIKEENNKKIEQYEIILEKTENELSDLILKDHKLKVKYNKNNKEILKLKKIINIGCTSIIVILTIPVALKSALAGLAISGLFGGWLALSQKTFKTLKDTKNINYNCTELDQTLVLNEIKELEKFKYTIENSIFVRDVLNAMLDNQRIAVSELETVSNVFNDDDILLDFTVDEYHVLNNYINDYNKEELTLNNYSNELTKEKVKIKK